MTTLRTFQDEIEEIHHREVAKKRAQVLSDRKEKEKDVKKSTGAVLTGSDRKEKEKDAKKGTGAVKTAVPADKGKAPEAVPEVVDDDEETIVTDEQRIQVTTHVHLASRSMWVTSRL